MRSCSTCGTLKEESEFYFRRDSNTFRSQCTHCFGFQYLLNRAEILKKKKSYRIENLALCIARERKQKRSDSGRAYARQYRRDHHTHRLQYNNLWRRARYKTNPEYKLLCLLRTRLTIALKGGKGIKSLSAVSLLGCPLWHLRAHLEFLFRPGMDWNTWGTAWELDHIKPCASFDFRDVEQQKACFHWTNLQPLFAEENRQKSNKL